MIELRDVSIRSGAFTMEHIQLAIPPAKHVVLMGKTGAGKTTLLEAICGLRRIHSGRVLLNNVDVTTWDPADRRIGYVPQDRALFPSMTVQQHLAFALTIRKVSREAIRRRVDELADLLGIKALLPRGVQNLSGGESQRVALGRALAAAPPVLLLDEPLSALDDSTRAEIHELLRRIQRETGVTTLHVTHHRDDAEALADCVLVLNGGRIQEG